MLGVFVRAVTSGIYSLGIPHILSSFQNVGECPASKSLITNDMHPRVLPMAPRSQRMCPLTRDHWAVAPHYLWVTLVLIYSNARSCGSIDRRCGGRPVCVCCCYLYCRRVSHRLRVCSALPAAVHSTEVSRLLSLLLCPLSLHGYWEGLGGGGAGSGGQSGERNTARLSASNKGFMVMNPRESKHHSLYL